MDSLRVEWGRTAAAEVLVPNPGLTLDREGPAHAFRGDVDVPIAAERGCRDEEHLLLVDPWDEVVRDLVGELAHGRRRIRGEGEG